MKKTGAVLTDRLRCKGTFKLDIYENDVLISSLTKNNLIVDLGRDDIVHLIAGDGASKFVSKIAFGTNGTTPAAGDTAITAQFIKAIDSFSYPVLGTVEFDWACEKYENNGMIVEEFGLMSDDGTLFARVVHAPITKTNLIRLVGSWSISL